MKNRIFALVLLALAVVAYAPTYSYANSPSGETAPHDGKHAKMAVPPMSKEQRDQMHAIMKEHHDAMLPLMEQLREKRMELEALSPNPNTQPDELRAIIREIISLENKIREQKKSLRKDLQKAGIPAPKGGFHDHPARSDFLSPRCKFIGPNQDHAPFHECPGCM